MYSCLQISKSTRLTRPSQSASPRGFPGHDWNEKVGRRVGDGEGIGFGEGEGVTVCATLGSTVGVGILVDDGSGAVGEGNSVIVAVGIVTVGIRLGVGLVYGTVGVTKMVADGVAAAFVMVGSTVVGMAEALAAGDVMVGEGDRLHLRM